MNTKDIFKRLGVLFTLADTCNPEGLRTDLQGFIYFLMDISEGHGLNLQVFKRKKVDMHKIISEFYDASFKYKVDKTIDLSEFGSCVLTYFVTEYNITDLKLD